MRHRYEVHTFGPLDPDEAPWSTIYADTLDLAREHFGRIVEERKANGVGVKIICGVETIAKFVKVADNE
jgi:hypothetical protein